jgi:hypothetical protein
MVFWLLSSGGLCVYNEQGEGGHKEGALGHACLCRVSCAMMTGTTR